MAKSGKGQNFERQLCDQLSLWWTQNEEKPKTDIFWRSSNSGGRATTRQKKNKTTSGQYGDVAAIDPIGVPFLKVVTPELKRGYSTDTIAELLDKPKTSAQQIYESWFEKAIRSHIHAGSYSWMLITKRDRRDAFCFFPNNLWNRLTDKVVINVKPFFVLDTKIRFKDFEISARKEIEEEIVGCRFDDFFDKVKPEHILDLYNRRFITKEI